MDFQLNEQQRMLQDTSRRYGELGFLGANLDPTYGAGNSEAYVVHCRMVDLPGAKGIGAVLMEKSTPGISFGTREHYVDFRGITSADMIYNDVAGRLAMGYRRRHHRHSENQYRGSPGGKTF